MSSYMVPSLQSHRCAPGPSISLSTGFVLLVVIAAALSKAAAGPPTTGPTPARQTARGTLEAAIAQFAKDHDIGRARAGFAEAFRQDPTFSDPCFNLAILAKDQEEWGEAVKWFEEVRRLSPQSQLAVRAQAHAIEARRMAEQDRTPEGKRARQYDGHIRAARALMEVGLAKEAVARAAAAAKIDDLRWEAYAISAAALAKQQLFSDALSFLEKAAARAPAAQKSMLSAAIDQCKNEQRAAELTRTAAAKLDAKDYLGAVAGFASACEMFPDRGDYALALAMSLAMSGEYSRAADLLSRLRGSRDPGIARQARSMLERLATRNAATQPTTAADAKALIARRHLASNDFQRAAVEFRAIIQLEPHNPQWHAELGDMLSRQEQWDLAAASYRLAAELAPENVRWRRNLGACLLQAKRWNEAVVAYQDAVRLDSGTASHHAGLGAGLFHAGRRQDAVAAFREAVRLDPNNAEYRTNLDLAAKP